MDGRMLNEWIIATGTEYNCFRVTKRKRWGRSRTGLATRQDMTGRDMIGHDEVTIHKAKINRQDKQGLSRTGQDRTGQDWRGQDGIGQDRDSSGDKARTQALGRDMTQGKASREQEKFGTELNRTRDIAHRTLGS